MSNGICVDALMTEKSSAESAYYRTIAVSTSQGRVRFVYADAAAKTNG